MADVEALKKKAGIEACQFVKSGMKVGLGTGSTVKHTVIELGRRMSEEGLEIVGVPTSLATEKLAIEVGIPLVELSEIDGLDIVIDGADEYDDKKQLIKGGGGALAREKIIAYSAREFICIVDESKKVIRLGAFPLAIEDLEYARSFVAREIVKLGGKPTYRTGFITDQGNQILDVLNLDYAVPYELEIRLNRIPGVVENGIFAQKTATKVVVATQKGVEVID